MGAYSVYVKYRGMTHKLDWFLENSSSVTPQNLHFKCRNLHFECTFLDEFSTNPPVSSGLSHAPKFWNRQLDELPRNRCWGNYLSVFSCEISVSNSLSSWSILIIADSTWQLQMPKTFSLKKMKFWWLLVVAVGLNMRQYRSLNLFIHHNNEDFWLLMERFRFSSLK